MSQIFTGKAFRITLDTRIIVDIDHVDTEGDAIAEAVKRVQAALHKSPNVIRTRTHVGSTCMETGRTYMEAREKLDNSHISDDARKMADDIDRDITHDAVLANSKKIEKLTEHVRWVLSLIQSKEMGTILREYTSDRVDKFDKDFPME